MTNKSSAELASNNTGGQGTANQAHTALPIPVVIGTGPSLAADIPLLHTAQRAGQVMLFGPNYTYRDFSLDVHLACDPALHWHHGRFDLPGVECWHWDAAICYDHGYKHIPGVWFDGLWVEDTTQISFGHSSGWQLINLAHHYITWHLCRPPILLVGFDMQYPAGQPRHYFSGLSDQAGEYAKPLRKFSLFDKGPIGKPKEGLLWDYKHIGRQVDSGEAWPIVNCTPASAMRWFEICTLKDALEKHAV